MKLYEVFTILQPNMSEDEINEFAENLQGALKQEGIECQSREVKLNQRLAYPIKHQRSGHFVRLNVAANEPADISRQVKEHLAANEKVIRQLIVASPRGGVEPAAAESVIDQLRRQERVERATSSRTDYLPRSQPTPEEPKRTGEGKADIEEIDKKIEELLK